jgi:phosphoribosyl 1,2-cyclic phosphate phosphodiesterase
MPAATIKQLADVDVMILDALRYRPHPSHMCVEESLALLEQITPRIAYLIHLCHDVDHDVLECALPPGVRVSYDGLRVRLKAGAEGVEWTEEDAS